MTDGGAATAPGRSGGMGGGCGRWLASWLVWPVLGVCIGWVFGAIASIGAPRFRWGIIAPFAGFWVGLVVGLLVAVSSFAMGPSGGAERGAAIVWGIGGAALGAGIAPALQLRGDSVSSWTQVWCVVTSACIAAVIGWLIARAGAVDPPPPVWRTGRSFGTVGSAAIVVCLLVVTVGEVVAGDDVDVRSGVNADGVSWVAFDGGFRVESAAALDGRVLVTVGGQHRQRRWYLRDEGSWRRISDGEIGREGPFLGRNAMVGVFQGRFAAIDLWNDQFAILEEGDRWSEPRPLPHEATYVDVSDEIIAIASRDVVSIDDDTGWRAVVRSDDQTSPVVSVAGTELLAVGDSPRRFSVGGGDDVGLEPLPASACRGRAALVPDAARDQHVAVVGCDDAFEVWAARPSDAWRLIGSVDERHTAPPLAVEGDRVVAARGLEVTVNGRTPNHDAALFNGIEPMVFLSDPGESTGFFCCG